MLGGNFTSLLSKSASERTCKSVSARENEKTDMNYNLLYVYLLSGSNTSRQFLELSRGQQKPMSFLWII